MQRRRGRAHLCAAVLQTGRVCGGRHHGQDCKAKGGPGLVGCGGQACSTPGTACSERPPPMQQAAKLVDKSEEMPTRKRARQQEPSSASRAPPVPVEGAPRTGRGGESAGEDQHFDDLARQGRKIEPLVLSLRSGGKLWSPHAGQPGRLPGGGLAGDGFQAEAKGTRRLGAARRDPGADADQMELGLLTGLPSPRVSMGEMRCCCTAWRVAIALPRCRGTSTFRPLSAIGGPRIGSMLLGGRPGSQPLGRCRWVIGGRSCCTSSC